MTPDDDQYTILSIVYWSINYLEPTFEKTRDLERLNKNSRCKVPFPTISMMTSRKKRDTYGSNINFYNIYITRVSYTSMERSPSILKIARTNALVWIKPT